MSGICQYVYILKKSMYHVFYTYLLGPNVPNPNPPRAPNFSTVHEDESSTRKVRENFGWRFFCMDSAKQKLKLK